VFGISAAVALVATSFITSCLCLRSCSPAVFRTIAFVFNTAVSSTFFTAAVFSIGNSEDVLLDFTFTGAAQISVLVVMVVCRLVAWWIMEKCSKRCNVSYDELHDSDDGEM